MRLKLDMAKVMTESLPEKRVEEAIARLSDPERQVTVNLDDLMRVYRIVEDLHHFFHQPDHNSDLTSLKKYLGNRKSGGCHMLHECYYKVLWSMLTMDIRDDIERNDV